MGQGYAAVRGTSLVKSELRLQVIHQSSIVLGSGQLQGLLDTCNRFGKLSVLGISRSQRAENHRTLAPDKPVRLLRQLNGFFGPFRMEASGQVASSQASWF